MPKKNNNKGPKTDKIDKNNKETNDGAMETSENLEKSSNVRMSKNEALAFFGLDKTATPFLIEEKYWQHIKRYRTDSKKYQEELDRVNAIYQIASGKEVTIKSLNTHKKTEKKRISANSVLNHLYYSWFKYLALIIFLTFMFFFVRQVFFTPKVDFYIIGLGHFQRIDNVMSEFAEEELGYKRPFFGVADMIVDGSNVHDAYTAQGSLIAAAFLQTGVDVIISDATTIPYYFEYLVPIDHLYEELIELLPPERAQGIVPVYLSYAQYIELVSSFDYYEDIFDEEMEEIELLPEHFEKNIYGLMIEDPELIDALGMVNRWDQHEPSLVFAVSAIANEPEGAENFIRQIFLTDPQIFIDARGR